MTGDMQHKVDIIQAQANKKIAKNLDKLMNGKEQTDVEVAK